eukprot:SAG31_NODE_510_length_14725_cov_2.829482_6_plen_124_part_00
MAVANRSCRAHAPPRREFLASQIWRNGKDPIANAAPHSAAMIGPHLERRHDDPFDPWSSYRSHVAREGNREAIANLPALGAFPGHITQPMNGRRSGGRRMDTLVSEGLTQTRKMCSVRHPLQN